jgi:hypothetical protein
MSWDKWVDEQIFFPTNFQAYHHEPPSLQRIPSWPDLNIELHDNLIEEGVSFDSIADDGEDDI